MRYPLSFWDIISWFGDRVFSDGIVCSYVLSERDSHGLLTGLFDEFNAFQPEAPCIHTSLLSYLQIRDNNLVVCV